MSKGLKALERISNHIEVSFDYSSDEDLSIIEKELKQAEENEKLLNVFKNALTIEHHDYPMVELDHSKDVMSCFVKELATIRQNELDKNMRKALREWVLKNAFPKELKALEIIKRIVKIVDFSDHTIANGNLIILQGGEIKSKKDYDLLKEVMLCH